MKHQLHGPAYLKNFITTPDPELEFYLPGDDVETHTWQLVSTTGGRWFKLVYDGEIDIEGKVIDSGAELLRIHAIDIETNQEIVVFDKRIHGWTGLFIESYGVSVHGPQSVLKPYRWNGKDVFQLLIVAQYAPGPREELIDKSENGMVKLKDGRSLPMQEVLADAFDGIDIHAFDLQGRKYTIVCETLQW